MKCSFKALWLVGILVIGGLARADVDLDLFYPTTSKAKFYNALQSSIDISDDFLPIQNQAPLGACQSFAMAAWLEYIYFFKNGHALDLSEKHLAYSLLDFMVDDFWDPVTKTYKLSYLDEEGFISTPQLGSGVAPFLIESYLKFSAIPDGAYSFGNMSAGEGTLNLDIPLYEKYFENSKASYGPRTYRKKLTESFLGQPPKRFIYNVKRTDFSSGKEESIQINSASEIAQAIGLSRDNVKTYYNRDYVGYQSPISREDTKGLMRYFNKISNHFDQLNVVTSGEVIEHEIIKSLDRRMAVMVASNVWCGGWTDGVVYGFGGGHAMVIVGYQERDGQLYFKLRNSWGSDKLVEGYNYVKAETLRENILYIVTHEV